MPNYAAWPTTADVDLTLASAGVTLRAAVTTAYKQQVIDAVAEEIERRTRRQWVAASAARDFDGSGTPELEIDEYTSVTSVALLAADATVAYTYAATEWDEVAEAGLPRTRLVLSRVAMAGVFPEGRQNVRVTASWGFGATIPEDLWQAACSEAAARLADEAVFASAGRIDLAQSVGVTTRYNLGVPGIGAGKAGELERAASWCIGWHQQFARTVKRYRRGLGRRARRLRAAMA